MYLKSFTDLTNYESYLTKKKYIYDTFNRFDKWDRLDKFDIFNRFKNLIHAFETYKKFN